MNTKKALAIVVVFAVLLIAVLMLAADKQKSDQNSSQENNQASTSDAGQMPKFIMGSVTRVEGQKVFVSSEGEKTVVASGSTKIVKQVKAKDGSISLAEGNLADVKAGNTIVAYYSSGPVGTEYQADKIQIIN
jgi:hypothetical protein